MVPPYKIINDTKKEVFFIGGHLHGQTIVVENEKTPLRLIFPCNINEIMNPFPWEFEEDGTPKKKLSWDRVSYVYCGDHYRMEQLPESDGKVIR